MFDPIHVTSMTSNVLHIRPMMRSDIDNAVERAAAEGWNPGWHDADTLHAADAGGLLLRQINDTPVAAIAAVR